MVTAGCGLSSVGVAGINPELLMPAVFNNLEAVEVARYRFEGETE
jgi:hypothetical protein